MSISKKIIQGAFISFSFHFISSSQVRWRRYESLKWGRDFIKTFKEKIEK